MPTGHHRASVSSGCLIKLRNLGGFGTADIDSSPCGGWRCELRAPARPGGRRLLRVYPQLVQRPRPGSLVSSYKGADPVRGAPALMTSQRPHPQMPSHGGSLSRYKFRGDTSIRSAAAAAPGAVSGLPLETPRDPREAETVSQARRGEVGATRVWVDTRGAGSHPDHPLRQPLGCGRGPLAMGPSGATSRPGSFLPEVRPLPTQHSLITGGCGRAKARPPSPVRGSLTGCFSSRAA